MKLSIIIPVYNSEKHIVQCLNSVLNQGLDKRDYEVIIVNDGSTDNSLEIAQSFAFKNHHIKVIDKDNGGAGSARNLGMDCAEGNYIYFIDSDDYLMENSLNKVLKICEDQKLDILTFLSKPFSASSKGELILKKNNFDVSFGDNILSPVVTGLDYVANVNYRSEVWWFMVNREFLKNSEIRFVEGRYLEDVVFSIDLILKAKQMAHLKLDAHRYRIAPGTAMTSQESSHYLRIIRDLQNAATKFDPIIKELENKNAIPECVTRVKARQQSFVFFSMMRMLKSTMSFEEVKKRMREMAHINAFPLDSFLGEDYNGLHYQILVSLFKTKRRFYFLFQLLNPIIKLRYKFINPI